MSSTEASKATFAQVKRGALARYHGLTALTDCVRELHRNSVFIRLISVV